jgi:hypothetical protein
MNYSNAKNSTKDQEKKPIGYIGLSAHKYRFCEFYDLILPISTCRNLFLVYELRSRKEQESYVLRDSP